MTSRIKRARQKNGWRLSWLLLPTLLAVIYYGGLAADQYVCEARFVVRDAADQPASSGLAQLAAQSRAASVAQALRDYLLSRDAMHMLGQSIDLRRVWAGSMRDPLTHLSAQASDSALYDRYTDRVSLLVNGSSGVVTLKVQSFQPADATQIARQLLALGQQTAGALSDTGHLVLIPLVAPDLPDEPAEPRRLRMILTIFGFNLIFVAMAWLVGTGLREHAVKDR